MPYYRFKKDDIFHNVIKTHPKSVFSIYGGRVFYNNSYVQSVSFTGSVAAPTGTISLLEQNVDRQRLNTSAPDFPGLDRYSRLNADGAGPDFIYPWIPKTGDQVAFKLDTTGTVASSKYGTIYTGPAQMTASISRRYYDKDTR